MPETPRRTPGERARRARLADAAAGIGLEGHDPALPVWLPAEGARMVSCGEYWDAVRVHLPLGENVLDVLGDRSGAAIASYPDQRLTWLVPPDTLHPHPPAYRVYGDGCRIEIPCADPDEALWLAWHIPPSGDCLTDPDVLRRALDTLLPPEAGDDR